MDFEIVLLLIPGCSPDPRRRPTGSSYWIVPQYSPPNVEAPREPFEDADNVPAAVSSWRGLAVGRLQDSGWCRCYGFETCQDMHRAVAAFL